MTHDSGIEKIMIREMKFWEVMSVFRESNDLLASVFNRDEWRDPYYDWFQRINDLVSSQNREILDFPVPYELTKEIAKEIITIYYLDESTGNLRADNFGANNNSIREMTTLEVHDSFGGAVIEEIHEKGSFNPKFK